MNLIAPSLHRREKPPRVAIIVGKEQPTNDLIQQHVTVSVSVEKAGLDTPGSIDAELSHTYLDLDYSQAGYDPTDGECEPINVYFFVAGHHVTVKASPVLLSGKTWRIWLEVQEVTCGE